VLGDERDPPAGQVGASRAREHHNLAVDRDRPSDTGQGTEQRQQEVALALAVEPAEPDDLAGPHLEVDVLEAPGPRQIRHLQRRWLGRLLGWTRREHALHVAPDRALDGLAPALAARGAVADVAAVAVVPLI